ncbi:MAG TPA: hypothetical protein VM051_01220 [Usitatibacter sp.]|nr:hypothetical protein [Usitatibacter sp.]
MLREITTARRVPGEEKRRWFSSPDIDLFVWVNEAGAPTGFQLCYDKQLRERALTWTEERGFSHMGVDAGEARPGRHKGAPILTANGAVDARRILDRFRDEAKALPEGFVQFVEDKVRQIAKEP